MRFTSHAFLDNCLLLILLNISINIVVDTISNND